MIVDRNVTDNSMEKLKKYVKLCSFAIAAASLFIAVYQLSLVMPGSLTIEWKPNESLVPTERFSVFFVVNDICELEEFSIDCLMPMISNKTNKTISNLNINYAFISENPVPVGKENPSFDVSSSQVDGTYKTVFHYKENSLGPFASAQSPKLSSMKTKDHQSIRLELRVTHEGIRKPLQLSFEILPKTWSGLNINKAADKSNKSQEGVLSANETKLFKFVQKNFVQKYPLYVVVSTQGGKSFIFDTKIKPNKLHRFADNRTFKFNSFSIRQYFEMGISGYLLLFFVLFLVGCFVFFFVINLEISIDDIRDHLGWRSVWSPLILLCAAVIMVLSFGFFFTGTWSLLN